MFSHERIWAAIDALAARHHMSPSALARLAGLDATAFNRSKRHSPDGRPRWPSTESLSKVLEATQASVEDFLMLLQGSAPETKELYVQPSTTVPLLGLAEAGDGGYFDDAGFPVGGGWDAIQAPSLNDDNAYALEVSGTSMMPLYRDGDILIISPNAQVRRGDRVVVRTRDGEVLAKVLHRRTASQIELHSLNPEHANRMLKLEEIEWIARIIWASQ